jgi:hypothetical protein
MEFELMPIVASQKFMIGFLPFSQGAISIQHWTGIEPELQVMRRKLEHIFGV